MVKRKEKDQGSITLESSHEESFESVGKVVNGVKSHSKIQYSADTKANIARGHSEIYPA